MSARMWIATVVGACACALVAAAPAHAAFGDDFGVGSINQPGFQLAPAFPGTEAVWAGTCRIDRAPAPGGAVPAPGVGVLPEQILVPDGTGIASSGQTLVAAPPTPPHCIDWGAETFGVGANPTNLWNIAPAWRLAAQAQAGSHPDGTATFVFDRPVDGSIDDVVVDLPAGFVGDPNAVPKCAADQFAVRPTQCPPQTQVGVLHLQLVSSIAGNIGGAGGNDLEVVPVFNLEPRQGNVAELGFANLGDVNATSARIVAKARTNGDFGVTTFIGQIPAALPLISQSITIWGVPWAPVHDLWRAPLAHTRGSGPCAVQPGTRSGVPNVIPPAGLTGLQTNGEPCAQSYDPSWGEVRPFVSNLTECDPANPVTTFRMDTYQNQGAMTIDGDPDPTDPTWKTYQVPADPVTGCQKPPFDPAASFAPTSTAADSPSGLSVDIRIPQNRDLPFDPPPAGSDQAAIDSYLSAAADHWHSDAGLATAQLDKTVVTLPDGMSVNPSAAPGLRGCSDAQMGVRQVGSPYLFDNSEPSCPEGSRLGIATASTPLLDEPLTGEFILGTPKSTDPTSGEMLRTFLVLRDPDRGLLAKVYGSTVADPATGRLTATFDDNPRVPVQDIEIELKGGPRGLFAMPQQCGPAATRSQFTPWTAAHGGGGPVRDLADGFAVGGDCSRGFAPTFKAGMDRRSAGGLGGTFSFEFGRDDGERWLAGLTAKLPKGLLASVKGLPLCTGAQAAAGACPPGSRLGLVDAAAGSGDPFVLEQEGDIYLTEGYKGCPYGLAVKIRPIAGPFRGQWELSPIVVRQAVCVDRRTGQVSAVSDPFPLIHHGVPLRVRHIVVKVDRPAFMRNPTGCHPKRVRADLSSPDGAAASPTTRFRVSGCAALRFRPNLELRLAGRRQTTTGRHPGIRAQVTQRPGEAGIKRAVVALPKSLALDVNNAQALCEFEDGTKPDLESHCPRGSIVGRARAVSPLLNRPLRGNVYFVKNVRIDPDTGNEIRTLPMIIAALRGEIAINLRGNSNTTRAGKLVNKFRVVPDAPVSRFNLNVKGGKNGILAVTRTRRSTIDICRKKQIAIARMNGHNGKRHDRRIRMATPCGKKKKAGRKKARERRR